MVASARVSCSDWMAISCDWVAWAEIWLPIRLSLRVSSCCWIAFSVAACCCLAVSADCWAAGLLGFCDVLLQLGAVHAAAGGVDALFQLGQGGAVARVPGRIQLRLGAGDTGLGRSDTALGGRQTTLGNADSMLAT